MPRREQFQAEVMATPRAQVAAASRYTMRRGDDRKPPRDDTGWQRTAWLWYDTIGEYRFACSWVGNLLSRAILYVTEDGETTTNTDAIAAMQSLFGGVDGQREMLRQLGIQFTVAGEAYLVGEDGGEEPGDKWWVVAASEISKTGDIWKVGKKEVDDPLIVRLWRAPAGEQQAGFSVTGGPADPRGNRRAHEARRRADRLAPCGCGHPPPAGRHLIRHHIHGFGGGLRGHERTRSVP